MPVGTWLARPSTGADTVVRIAWGQTKLGDDAVRFDPDVRESRRVSGPTRCSDRPRVRAHARGHAMRVQVPSVPEPVLSKSGGEVAPLGS